MQHLESGDSLVLGLPHNTVVHGDLTGFSHGAFNSNLHSAGGFRDRQGSNMASINTIRANNSVQHSAQNVEMQTPGTTYDMNFTPLLPSQLLMGSPFQPGSPATFASPQFQGFSHFPSHGPVVTAQSQPTQASNALQAQQPMSSQLFTAVAPAGTIPSSQLYGGPQPGGGAILTYGHNFGPPPNMAVTMSSGSSRVVYLGNIPPDTSVEELLNHVRSGQIESVKTLMDRSCVFISFLDGSSAVHFHSDAMLKKINIRGQELKVGWGKPSPVPALVVTAVQQSGASRNVYLGNIPQDVTEEEIREDLGRFGPIDTVKLVREKSIGFVHFLSISSAIKAVNQLPQEEKWQAPRRVFYGKDRCAYVSKTQQQNAAQFLGISPAYAHLLSSADRDYLSTALTQQSVAAAAVATAAGGTNNVGNRTVYLGNIHPETSTEEICNVVRGGLLHHIRYIPDKHICFVTFIDPTAAAAFYALSNLQGLMIHNRRLKIGWGKHSGPLPPAIAMAVSAGASRNVYVGNIDETWSEDRLRQDFAEYGETELVNMLREKSCAFVNFLNISNSIRAIESIKGKEEYKRCKVNFGKDRCGNPPRQPNQSNQDHGSQHTGSGPHDGVTSLVSAGAYHTGRNNQMQNGVASGGQGVSRQGQMHNGHGPSQSNFSGGNNNNTFAMYLNQVPMMNGQQSYVPSQHMQNQANTLSAQTNSYYGTGPIVAGVTGFQRHGSLEVPQQNQLQYTAHGTSNSFNAPSPAVYTVNGMLAPSNVSSVARTQHSRAISLPAYSQAPFNPQQQHQQPQSSKNVNFNGGGTGLGLAAGSGLNGFGLAIHGESPLSRWAEEEANA